MYVARRDRFVEAWNVIYGLYINIVCNFAETCTATLKNEAIIGRTKSRPFLRIRAILYFGQGEAHIH